MSATPHADLAGRGQLRLRVVPDRRRSPRAQKKSKVLLNLNVPKRWSGEVRTTRLGSRIYEEAVDFRSDLGPRVPLLGGPTVHHERDAGTDTDAYDDGAASITPPVLDLTDTTTDEGLAASITSAITAAAAAGTT